MIRRMRAAIGPISLFAVIVGAGSLLAAFLVFILLPESESSLRVLIAIGCLLLLVFFFTAFDQVKRVLMGRKARFGVNTGVMILAFAGIAVLTNFVSERNHSRYDMTASQQFSLSKQTVKIAKDLPEKVKIIAFFGESADPVQGVVRSETEDILREYRRQSDKISYEFVDPYLRPDVQLSFGVNSSPPFMILTTGQRREVVQPAVSYVNDVAVAVFRERDIATALLRVTGHQQKKAYFLTGHGEPDTGAADDTGYAYALQGVKDDNYLAESLDLVASPKVPDDCSVLIIAGPQKDLQQPELDAIQAYLERAGRVLFLLDPVTPPGLRDLLKRWGLDLPSGVVVEGGDRHLEGNDRAIIVDGSGMNPYVQATAELSGSLVILPEVTSVSPAEGLGVVATQGGVPVFLSQNGALMMVPLLFSTSDSYQLTDASATAFDEKRDLKGPLLLGATVTATGPVDGQNLPTIDVADAKKARIALIGDSQFANNFYWPNYANSDLFLNNLNWLTEDEALISVRTKGTGLRMMDVSDKQWRWIQVSVIGLLPLAVVVVGGLTWYRRR